VVLRPFLIAAALVIAARAPALAQSPCSDSSYLAMKRRPVDSLSAREYEVFRERDRACFATAHDSGSARQAGGLTEFAGHLMMGQVAGRAAADVKSTRGWYAKGVAGGLVLGIFGATLVHNAASSSKSAPTAQELSQLQGKSAIYVQGFTDAYNSHLLNKRERSAFQGGMLGTITGVIGVVVIIASVQP
jgi:hypothetical protein